MKDEVIDTDKNVIQAPRYNIYCTIDKLQDIGNCILFFPPWAATFHILL